MEPARRARRRRAAARPRRRPLRPLRRGTPRRPLRPLRRRAARHAGRAGGPDPRPRQPARHRDACLACLVARSRVEPGDHRPRRGVPGARAALARRPRRAPASRRRLRARQQPGAGAAPLRGAARSRSEADRPARERARRFVARAGRAARQRSRDPARHRRSPERHAKASDGGEIVVARDVLAASPWLAGPSGLGLDPALLDGDRRNGELAEGGVTLANGAMRLVLENPDGPGEHVETRPLEPAAYGRARAAAEEALYARLVTTDRRSADTGRFERYIPFFFQGEIDAGGGLSLYPGVKMRRYDSEDGRLYE